MVCIVPVSPMRSEPAHQYEIVSQLLFGETVEVIDQNNDGWMKIKCLYDGYQGWITRTHLMETQLQEKFTEALVGDWINIIWQNNKPMRIPFGATIPFTDTLSMGSITWNFTGVKRLQPQTFTEVGLLTVTDFFLNTAYMWGGRSVFGIDCSGFAQQVFRHFNICIPRDAYLQAEKGETVDNLQQARCGDLAFFNDSDGRITHVGILLSEYQIIHASGKVRTDAVDRHGIINSDTGLYTHRLCLLKRIVHVEI